MHEVPDRRSLVCAVAVLVAVSMTRCTKDSPTQPSQPAAPSLTAPLADLPSDDQQLTTLQPSLRVIECHLDAGRHPYLRVPGLVQRWLHSYRGVGAERRGGRGRQDERGASLQRCRRRRATGGGHGRCRAAPPARGRARRSSGRRSRAILRAGELYDPLANGEAVGDPRGITFVRRRRPLQRARQPDHVSAAADADERRVLGQGDRHHDDVPGRPHEDPFDAGRPERHHRQRSPGHRRKTVHRRDQLPVHQRRGGHQRGSRVPHLRSGDDLLLAADVGERPGLDGSSPRTTRTAASCSRRPRATRARTRPTRILPTSARRFRAAAPTAPVFPA